MVTMVVLVAVACGFVPSMAGASAAGAGTPSPALGAYVGPGQPDSVDQLGTSVGGNLNYAMDFLDPSSWAAFTDPTWPVSIWAGRGYRMIWGVPMLPNSGGSMAIGASGGYDRYFQTLSRNLVAQGEGSSVLRIGWEFNGSWFPWGTGHCTPGQFVAYWQQIVTTIGATHALDVVTRTLLHAGDSVLVDEPGWSVEYARLAALGMHVLPVPRGEHGPDVAAMRRLIEAQKPGARPRLYVTVSVLHNPTGASLNLQSAHRVLQLASEFGIHIVEDDTYAHLAPAHAPRLAALDALERTIYISGFSKILTPNWRVGYLAAPQELVDRFIDTKLLSTLTTPGAGELAIAHCLEQGWLRKHSERVVQRLAAARARTVKLAEVHGCRFVSEPHGLFGWVDTGVDTERLAHVLLDEWLIAPGSLFHAEPRPTTLMRINFATSQDTRFWKALAAARIKL